MVQNFDVTILLATYNGKDYIAEQLDSLLGQSYSSFVCYIHDDGSTDGTIEIIKKYEERFPDKFKIYDYERKGSSQLNFYSLLPFITTPYAMFCDQDDVWKKDKIEKELNELKKLELEEGDIPILVFTDLEVVDKQLNTIDTSFFKYMSINPENTSIKLLLFDGVAAGCTIMLNKKLVDLINRSNHGEIMHDLWATFIASALGKIVFLPESTIYYRQHGNNVIGAKIKGKKRILDRKRILLSKLYVERVRDIAKRLLTIMPFDHEDYFLIKEISAISKRNKFYRVYFYWKHNLFSSKSNKLWISMWL